MDLDSFLASTSGGGGGGGGDVSRKRSNPSSSSSSSSSTLAVPDAGASGSVPAVSPRSSHRGLHLLSKYLGGGSSSSKKRDTLALASPNSSASSSSSSSSSSPSHRRGTSTPQVQSMSTSATKGALQSQPALSLQSREVLAESPTGSTFDSSSDSPTSSSDNILDSGVSLSEFQRLPSSALLALRQRKQSSLTITRESRRMVEAHADAPVLSKIESMGVLPPAIALTTSEAINDIARHVDVGSDVYNTEVSRTATFCDAETLELRGRLMQNRELQRIALAIKDYEPYRMLQSSVLACERNDPLVAADSIPNPWIVGKFPGTEEMQAANKRVDKELVQQQRQRLSMQQVLVVGSRTPLSYLMWRQLESMLSDKTVSAVYQRQFKKEALSMLHYLANTALQLNLTFGRQNNLMSAQKFLTFTTNIDWTSQHTKEMKVLFNDPAIQQVVDQCTPTQQYKFRFLIKSMERVFDKKFSPVAEDTLFISGLLSGVREVKFQSKETRMQYRFVGVQRLNNNSRKKWMHHFWDFNIILMFACIEDEVQARESILLYESLVRDDNFQNANIIVYVEGSKLLQARAIEIDLGDHFKTYNGGRDSEAALQFVYSRLQARPRTWQGKHYFKVVMANEKVRFLDLIEQAVRDSMMNAIADAAAIDV